MCKNRTNPYLGKFNIVLYTSDDSGTCCGVFENAVDLAKFLYGGSVKTNQIHNVRTKLYRVRAIKRATKKPVCMELAKNETYEIDFVIA